jgi:ABC-2 type transport system permease protein
MGRYLRLYLYFLRFSFSRAMEFRLDFAFRIFMDMFYYIVNITFFSIIYRHTNLLGGWDYHEILIFVCGFFLIDAIHMTVFANNMWFLPQFVNKGELDYYLVRPVSSLFFLSLRDFAANSFVNLLIAAGLVAWAIGQSPHAMSPLSIGAFIFFLLNGALLYQFLHLMFIIPVFWLHSNRGLGDLFYAVEKYCDRPDRIFSGPIRRVLTTILPFSLVASFPARLILDGLDGKLMLYMLGVTGVMFFVSVAFWRLALKNYTSASS